MTAETSRDDGPGRMAGSQPARSAEHSPARRRLVRTAMAAPVVLGSLASKPVLGAAPYQCTISGQVSGNLSRSSDVSVCRIGINRAAWLADNSWPTQITKGGLPNNGCNFNAGAIGTVFNGYIKTGTPPLLNAFRYAAGGGACNVLVVTGVTTTPAASMHQVLSTTTGGEQFELGRAVVISLLNSYRFAPNYPLTDDTIIAMCNATFNGGTFLANDKVPWTRAQVIAYLTSLYPPG